MNESAKKKEHFHDYCYVAPEHKDVHGKLVNWALWASPHPCPESSPMWRWTRSNTRQWHPVEPAPSIDMLAALAVQKMMHTLQPDQRSAIQWAYLQNSRSTNPAKWCREHGHLKDGKPDYGALYHLIQAGRGNLAVRLISTRESTDRKILAVA